MTSMFSAIAGGRPPALLRLKPEFRNGGFSRQSNRGSGPPPLRRQIAHWQPVTEPKRTLRLSRAADPLKKSDCLSPTGC